MDLWTTITLLPQPVGSDNKGNYAQKRTLR